MSELEPEQRSAEAQALVRKYMMGTAALGLVPLPLVEWLALAGVQAKMLSDLARLYDIPFSDERARVIIGAVVGGSGAVSLSLNLARLIRGMPVAGVATAAGAALFSGASTYAIGRLFIQHFEAGGTLLSFDPKQARERYNEHLEEGKAELRKSFAGVKP
ncbi:YcjF family protein [Endothiovibrio diazotrophicus]